MEMTRQEVNPAICEAYDRALGFYALTAATLMVVDLQMQGRVTEPILLGQADFSQPWLPLIPVSTYNVSKRLRDAYGRA